jgi:predicted PurR-regulated permease PerM
MKSAIFKTVVLVFLATASFASTEIKGVRTELNHSKKVQLETEQLYNRLEEINDLSKTKLTKEEKKSLRKEVQQIKERLAHVAGGVFISAGALILILILLIILV